MDVSSVTEHWSVARVRLTVELPDRLDVGDTVALECVLEVESTDSTPAPLELDGRGLVTEWVHVDGELPGDAAEVGEHTLTLTLAPGVHEVSTRVRARVGAPGDKGLVFHEGLLSTNLEPQGFRRLTWFPDRPSCRAIWDVSIVGHTTVFPQMFSNGTCVERASLAEGRHLARYVDPVPKPSYLFSLLAGELATRSSVHTTRSGASVTLTVAAPPSMVDGADFALRTLDGVMSFDEQCGALEHDLPELVYAAVPGYSDATEYHGLMFFEPSLLIAEPRGCTDDDLLLIVANVAHEYGHHARGNRVTVRSWGQLALKEGLTVLTAQNDHRRHLLGESARVLDVLDLRRLQFPEEVTIGAPVLRGEVDDPASLYTRTTYLKGAEVFGMLRTLLGAERWRTAVEQFNRRFDLSAAGVEDFVAVVREVAPDRAADVEGIARWFTLVGRPSLVVEVTEGSVSVRRDDALRDDPPVAVPMRLGFVGDDGRPVEVSIDGATPASEVVVVLDGREGSWRLAADRPFTLSTLRGYSAPVDLAVGLDDEALARLVRHDTDPFVRWWSAQELMIRTIDRRRGGDLVGAAAATGHLVTALRLALREVEDHLLLAQLLAVPDEFMLGDRDARIDIDGVAASLQQLRVDLGRELAEDLCSLWRRTLDADVARGDGATAITARMLVDPVLALLVAADDVDGLEIARRAVEHPETTVGIRAFGQLAHSEALDLDALAEATLARWGASPRLVDRWIRAQSGARRSDTIERVRRLSTGPLYDRDDRARVMAVWFPFATRNRSVFHHPSGEGYRLFTDELARLLATNAGTAVRLVGDLLQFRRFDDHRGALIRAELERLVDAPGLPDFAVGILRHLLA